MPQTHPIEVQAAPPEARPVFANLMQLYIHDFSEFWAGRPQGEVGEDGRFPDYPMLDLYWREPDRVPLLLRDGGRLIGFALINAVSHIERPTDRAMAEFFILRKHRRSGVGTAAAQAIFGRWPGLWEVAVARRNVAALAFWRRAITGHPHVSDVEEIDLATEDWDGPLFRFRIGLAA